MKQETVHQSPFELVYGRKTRTLTQQGTLTDYVRLQEIRTQAKDFIRTAQE